MKDKKWAIEQMESLKSTGNNQRAIAKRNAIERCKVIIDQLDEPAIPVVPQFIADFIEDIKSKGINLLVNIHDFTHDEEINDYIQENGDTMMQAWLNGYEVEKEKPIQVSFKSNDKTIERFELPESLANELMEQLKGAGK